MRKIYKNYIEKNELDFLSRASRQQKNLKYELLKANKNNANKINLFVKKMVDFLKKDFNFDIHDKSYFKVEETGSGGHNWHMDTGTNNHMPWCQVGCSIILKPGSGGDTYYADDKCGKNKVKSERMLCDLIAHTSDEWHMVEPSSNGRLVFLMFI